MKQPLLTLALALVLALSFSSRVFAHCEIPCGIYDDEMRFEMILEHIATIEKSMTAIASLSPPKEGDYNQLVRWVSNKEEHANKIQEIATQYFLAQRVKIPQEKKMMEDYVESLKRLHELVVYAMKAKQTTDLGYVKALRKSTESYLKLYRKLHGH